MQMLNTQEHRGERANYQPANQMPGQTNPLGAAKSFSNFSGGGSRTRKNEIA